MGNPSTRFLGDFAGIVIDLFMVANIIAYNANTSSYKEYQHKVNFSIYKSFCT